MATANSEYDYHLKILIIGNSGVGKSCMLMRYAENNFTNNFYNTIGVDFKIKPIMLNDKSVKLQIWDTAGQDKFKTITCSYYRGAHGIMIVYDITDRESYDQIKIWMQEIDKFAQEGVNKILIGNKSDLESERKVSYEEGQYLAKSYNIQFLEASAKSSNNVEEAFRQIALNVLEKQINLQKDENTKNRFKLKEGDQISQKNKNSCC